MVIPFDPVQAAFEDAIRAFRAELQDDQVYHDMLQVTSIDQVYDATDQIQREQAKEGHLRHLSKISPYLDRLNQYAASIEVFLQAKPEVLALIWGPIKLLLQWTSALKASFDAIVNTMAEIGELLPEFKRVSALFNQNAVVKEVMVLFFRDILDFYLVALKFFKLSRWKFFFESLWPKHKEKIGIVMTHVESHGRLMRNEVRLEHIQQEHEARQRALEHFEKEDRERRAQEFYRIRTDIAPQSYYHRLDLLRDLVYQGTGSWLLQDASFKTWLQPTQRDSRLLWLQGIPGAGKTYLSSEVVTAVQPIGHTAFAFLSYKESREITAISVLHSLVFGLVTGHDDLQTVICQSCSEESKRNLKGATELLTTVLACAGPAYLIVDGLDEMEEVERGRLLTRLLEIVKSSSEARLFISSRAEADLESILGDESIILRVEQRNLECIQTFVKHWTQSWFRERDFWPEERTEIEAGLVPLAVRSEGMFLYARVVLDSIKFLNNFVDIREELHALPESLDDAYGRILKRINNSDNYAMKEKARLILGWIGCAPTPLTVQEIQQALTLDLAHRGNIERVRGNLNLVRICGPVVEIVDDFVQFVHFTVKEYLFSPKISGFIDLDSATLDLTLRCVSYLGHDHHNLDLQVEQMHHNMLNGAYALDWFATNMWPQLTKNYLTATRQKEPPPALLSQLELLRTVRLQNQSLRKDDDDYTFPVEETLKEAHPELHALICQSLGFRQMCTASEHRMRTGAPWITLDPLTISETSVQIYQAAEYLLHHTQENGESYQHILHRWYGQQLYKCDYLHCQFNRVGFRQSSERRFHQKSHDRPWKCSVTGCEYTEGGFLSQKMRDDHLGRAHSDLNKLAVNASHIEDDDEAKLHLLDLIKADLVEDVEAFLSTRNIMDKVQRDKHWDETMCSAAVFSGSLRMVKLLRSKFNGLDYTMFFEGLRGSIEIYKYVIGGSFANDHWIITSAGSLDDKEKLDIWVESVKQLLLSDRTFQTGNGTNKFWHGITHQHVIRAMAKDIYTEGQLLQLWKLIQWGPNAGMRRKRDLGDALTRVANAKCSVALAEYLLESGALVDRRRSDKYPTALWSAARQSTRECAALMKLLLLHGADPNIKRQPLKVRGSGWTTFTKIEDEIGPRELSKWLGITWDELVEETKAERLSKSLGP